MHTNTSPYTLKLLASSLATAGYLFAIEALADKHLVETTNCSDWKPVINNQPVDMLPRELDILSWNIQKARDTEWATDLARIAQDVELSFIQEARVEADIHEVYETDIHHSFAQGFSSSRQVTGVMTLSSSMPRMSCSLTAREPWLRTPKATNVSSFPIEDSDEDLLAINLHAVNFSLGAKPLRAQLDALSAILHQHQGPIIVAGDLNTWSQKRQKQVDEFMSTHGLESVTFEQDKRSRVFGRVLDHIYVRGLTSMHAETFSVSSSDHNPIKVRLRVL